MKLDTSNKIQEMEAPHEQVIVSQPPSAQTVVTLDPKAESDRWNTRVRWMGISTAFVSVNYLALSIAAMVLQSEYAIKNCLDSYSCQQREYGFLYILIAHFLVSVLVVPVGLGFAIASTINKFSNRVQTSFAHVAINFLFSAFIVTFALMICSVDQYLIGSGVVFIVVTICDALLIPFLIKKIRATNFEMDMIAAANAKETTLVPERSEL